MCLSAPMVSEYPGSAKSSGAVGFIGGDIDVMQTWHRLFSGLARGSGSWTRQTETLSVSRVLPVDWGGINSGQSLVTSMLKAPSCWQHSNKGLLRPACARVLPKAFGKGDSAHRVQEPAAQRKGSRFDAARYPCVQSTARLAVATGTVGCCQAVHGSQASPGP